MAITGETGLDVDFPDQTKANVNETQIANATTANPHKREGNLLICLGYRNQSNNFQR